MLANRITSLPPLSNSLPHGGEKTRKTRVARSVDINAPSASAVVFIDCVLTVSIRVRLHGDFCADVRMRSIIFQRKVLKLKIE